MPLFYPDSESDHDNEGPRDDPPSSHTPGISPNAEHSHRLLNRLRDSGQAREIIHDILDYLGTKNVTLAVLIEAICWHPDFPELIDDPRIKYARTAFTHMLPRARPRNNNAVDPEEDRFTNIDLPLVGFLATEGVECYFSYFLASAFRVVSARLVRCRTGDCKSIRELYI